MEIEYQKIVRKHTNIAYKWLRLAAAFCKSNQFRDAERALNSCAKELSAIRGIILNMAAQAGLPLGAEAEE